MVAWKKMFSAAAYNAEGHFDSLKFRLRKRLGVVKRVMILPYTGYGNVDMIHITGRVVEDRGIIDPTDRDSRWRNLLNMYRRFASHEIRGARVRARIGSASAEAITDNDGFFYFNFPPDERVVFSGQYRYPVNLDLLEYPGPRQASTHTTVDVVVPPPDAQFGVISDLDDTVIKTDVANLLKLVRNTFLRNAHTRLPFEGVAVFYQALQAGTRGSYNPIYYVSSSPWNLYDLITDFFEIRGIPHGPMYLTDLGVTREHIIKPNRVVHKLKGIRTILNANPGLPFILIGDSGEVDPEIYVKAAAEHPGRIRAIYIRCVQGKSKRSRQRIIDQASAVGAELLFVQDTVGAAQHAVARGYILPETLPLIREERREDQKPPTPLELLLDQDSIG